MTATFLHAYFTNTYIDSFKEFYQLLPKSSCLSVISLHKIPICHKYVSVSLVYIYFLRVLLPSVAIFCRLLPYFAVFGVIVRTRSADIPFHLSVTFRCMAQFNLQENRPIAKMTTRCAQYMSAL